MEGVEEEGEEKCIAVRKRREVEYKEKIQEGSVTGSGDATARG